eukprot:726388-Pleurochrysis_carterae.AAC.1
MASATGVSRLHSVACCLRAAHAPAPVQAPRNGALRPLPLPRPSRSRLPPIARLRIALQGLRTKEFSPPRATNNATNEAREKPADFSYSKKALHGTRISLSIAI